MPAVVPPFRVWFLLKNEFGICANHYAPSAGLDTGQSQTAMALGESPGYCVVDQLVFVDVMHLRCGLALAGAYSNQHVVHPVEA